MADEFADGVGAFAGRVVDAVCKGLGVGDVSGDERLAYFRMFAAVVSGVEGFGKNGEDAGCISGCEDRVVRVLTGGLRSVTVGSTDGGSAVDSCVGSAVFEPVARVDGSSLGAVRPGAGLLASPGGVRGVHVPVGVVCGAGAVAGSAGVLPGAGRRGVGQLGRGPNYERNRSDRLRKKLQKQARIAEEGAHRDLRDDVDKRELEYRKEVVEVKRKAFRAKQELENLKLARVLREERQKKERYDGGMDHVQEAGRLLRDAAYFGRIAAAAEGTNAKVASWVATSSGGSAVSMARSAPVSVPSYDSVGSATELAVVRAPLSAVELRVVTMGKATERGIRDARRRCKRQLVLEDFFSKSSPYVFSVEERLALTSVVTGVAVDSYGGLDDY